MCPGERMKRRACKSRKSKAQVYRAEKEWNHENGVRSTPIYLIGRSHWRSSHRALKSGLPDRCLPIRVGIDMTRLKFPSPRFVSLNHIQGGLSSGGIRPVPDRRCSGSISASRFASSQKCGRSRDSLGVRLIGLSRSGFSKSTRNQYPGAL